MRPPALALALERTPPGSYLVYRVATVDELRDQVAKNPVVRSRYMTHFGVSAAELDASFANNLTIVTLKQPLRAHSWYIDDAGKILLKTKFLPKGTMVFATKDGKPLLIASCGNPLMSQLPAEVVKTMAQSETPPDTKVLASPMETISSALVTAPPALEVLSVLPVEAPPVLASIAAPAVSLPPFITSSSSLGAGWLGLLGAIGALAGGAGGGGGGGGVVPEPSSFIVLGSALCMIPGLYHIRRRRS